MVVADTDIKVYYTTGTKEKSVGGIVTNAAFRTSNDKTKRDEYVHTLFPQIIAEEVAGAVSNYLCLAVKNEHADEAWENVKAWIVTSYQVQSEITISIGKDTGDPLKQIASRYELPTTVTFVEPATKDDANVLDYGNLAAEGVVGLWIKRTPTADAKARSFEFVHIRIEGDTASGATTYCGADIYIRWNTITEEVSLTLEKLNDVPPERVSLRGIQEDYDDAMFLLNQIAASTVTDVIKARVARSRARYLAYAQWTVELERAGGGLPPMVVSRLYEYRRIANEMFNSITMAGAAQRDVHAIKQRSERGRIY